MTTLEPTNDPKTILITDGAGFIGSHLADALVAANHHVLAIDDLSTGRFDNIVHLIPNPNFHFKYHTSSYRQCSPILVCCQSTRKN